MPTIAAVLTKEQFDTIAEPVKGFYKATENGEYVLDTDITVHPQAQGLKAALVKEREAAKQAASSVQDLQGKEKSFEQKLTEALKERDTLQKRVRHLSIVEAGSRAIAAAKANQALLLPHLQQVADLDEKNRVIVRGEDGEPRLKKDWRGPEDYMGLEEYVNSLKDHPDFSVAFASSGASGTGGGADNRAPKPAYTPSTTAEGIKVW